MGITFVMGNTAAEKSLKASAGNLKGNSLLAYFSSIRINPFRKRIIHLYYYNISILLLHMFSENDVIVYKLPSVTLDLGPNGFMNTFLEPRSFMY